MMDNINVNVVSGNLSRRNSDRRRVSFPDTELVSYAEPLNPFNTVQNVTIEEIKTAYVMSCTKYGISPIDSNLKQIANFALIEGQREAIFELNNLDLTLLVCDSLEEIFRRVQFKEIEITECSVCNEGAMALFEMLNFYDSAHKIKVNITSQLDHEGWSALSQYLLRSEDLLRFEMYGMTLQESDSFTLISSLCFNYHLENFILKNIDFSQSLPMSYLACYLSYGVIQQLELSACGLVAKDIEDLCVGLRESRFLTVLQLGYNNIGDMGARCLLQCLAEREWPLTVLVLCHNGLTHETAQYLNNLLVNDQKINLINLSHNPFKDEGVLAIEENMCQNKSIRRFGLQKCGITDIGLEAISRIILRSSYLKRLDLRGNFITLNGWQSFCNHFLQSESPAMIDFDPEPVDKSIPLSTYQSLVETITNKAKENRLLKKEAFEEKKTPASRKISLTCQTLPIPIDRTLIQASRTSSGRLRSPNISPVSSPSTSRKPKSRFHITPVSETRYASSSRFIVSSVEDNYNIRKTEQAASNNNTNTDSAIKPEISEGFKGFDVKREQLDNSPEPMDNIEEIGDVVSSSLPVQLNILDNANELAKDNCMEISDGVGQIGDIPLGTPDDGYISEEKKIQDETCLDITMVDQSAMQEDNDRQS